MKYLLLILSVFMLSCSAIFAIDVTTDFPNVYVQVSRENIENKTPIYIDYPVVLNVSGVVPDTNWEMRVSMNRTEINDDNLKVYIQRISRGDGDSENPVDGQQYVQIDDIIPTFFFKGTGNRMNIECQIKIECERLDDFFKDSDFEILFTAVEII